MGVLGRFLRLKLVFRFTLSDLGGGGGGIPSPSAPFFLLPRGSPAELGRFKLAGEKKEATMDGFRSGAARERTLSPASREDGRASIDGRN